MKKILFVLVASFALACGAMKQPVSSASGATPASGERVRIETTDAGTLEATLMDKLPDGYLVRYDAGTTEVIPFARVRSLSPVASSP